MLARLARYAALLAIVLAGVAGWFAWRAYTAPLPLPETPFAFEVRAGSTLSAVARELGASGALPQPWALIGLARWRGTDRAIKAGSYEIEAGITLPRLLDKLTQGDVTQTSLVIVEGSTFADMKRVLRENSGDPQHRAGPAGRRDPRAARDDAGQPRGPLLPGHLFLRGRKHGRRAARSRAARARRAARRGVGASRGRAAAHSRRTRR